MITFTAARFPKVGQNYGYNYDSADQRQVVDAKGRVQDWFDEYKSFNPGLVRKYGSSSGVTTHFTQVSTSSLLLYVICFSFVIYEQSVLVIGQRLGNISYGRSTKRRRSRYCDAGGDSKKS